jgi:hypothetical protein
LIPVLDIYRAAKVVIDRDGEDAQFYAAARTVVHAGEGDEEGAAIWRQIAAAVEELQRTRRPDEAVN